ncbi:MAG: universal stress protein [Deltaproteobacteria bacterium]|nr:universal stress protein [Deltaproteobacteria bacterium]
MFAPKNILVPTDFSEYSDKSLQEAMDIANQYHSKIHLLHVAEMVIHCTVDYCLDPQTVTQVENETIQASKKMMQDQVAKFQKSNAVEIITEIRKGTPYEEILKDQQEKNIDLIVIASHGQTGLMRYLVGSVAEKVLRHSKSPVLLVRI